MLMRINFTSLPSVRSLSPRTAITVHVNDATYLQGSVTLTSFELPNFITGFS